ncbi:MAG: collagen-like protein, partial [Bradyrhizobium sp.]
GKPGEAGPPGQLPSIEQVMPWLHLLFDAWEDYKRLREREALEAAEREASAHEALDLDEPGEASDEDVDDKAHRKKKRHKDKHRK